MNTYLYVVQVCRRGGQEVDVITNRVEPRLVVVLGPPEFQAYRNHGIRGRERHGPPFRWNQIYNIHHKSLKKHPKQISNDISFHDWTINPNSEKLIIRSVKTHEQFLKEFGINMNQKNNKKK